MVEEYRRESSFSLFFFWFVFLEYLDNSVLLEGNAESLSVWICL